MLNEYGNFTQLPAWFRSEMIKVFSCLDAAFLLKKFQLFWGELQIIDGGGLMSAQSMLFCDYCKSFPVASPFSWVNNWCFLPAGQIHNTCCYRAPIPGLQEHHCQELKTRLEMVKHLAFKYRYSEAPRPTFDWQICGSSVWRWVLAFT